MELGDCVGGNIEMGSSIRWIGHGSGQSNNQGTRWRCELIFFVELQTTIDFWRLGWHGGKTY